MGSKRDTEDFDYSHYKWLVYLLNLVFYDMRENKRLSPTEVAKRKAHNAATLIIIALISIGFLYISFVWALEKFIL
jgi:hypothetical protein